MDPFKKIRSFFHRFRNHFRSLFGRFLAIRLHFRRKTRYIHRKNLRYVLAFKKFFRGGVRVKILSLGRENHDRVFGRFEHRLELLFTFRQLVFRFFTSRDIPADPQNTEHLSIRPPIGRLQGIEECLSPIGISDPFFVMPKLSRLQHDLVVFFKLFRHILAEKIIICFSDDLLFGPADEGGKARVATHINTVQILEKHKIGD
ncbi:MAG: hypothetical protein BWY44_00823 [Candidatus Omnitrophica bacterium ADurb.Bin292]|nr:MAG: hypothetical protein BWY44_00823 [Candidatus Omnitrophica bacterium ADurb.Bin292]